MRLDTLAVLVSGGGSNLQALLDAADRGELHARIGVVIADRACHALSRAESHGVKALCIAPGGFEKKADYDAALLDALLESGAQGVVLAGFLTILGANIVRRFEGRILNVHPSLIPAFCGMGFYGRKVHQAVLDYGCKVSGATVHLVDEGADTGPIVLQTAVPVLSGDTAETLAARVLVEEHLLLPKAVSLLAQGRIRVSGRVVTILPEE